MKIVTIANPINKGQITFVCRWEKTRNGFKHCVETDDGIKKDTHYINRTWECYPYQTALKICVEKWIKEKTGLNPNRKRDKTKFDELYNNMAKAIDSQHYC